jgi:hypothetical protein
MKSFLDKILWIAALPVLLVACKKDDKPVHFTGGTPPVLTSSVKDTIPLSYVNAAQEAVRLNWTNPDYTFNTGISSLDVSYLVEIDTAGSNFTNPGRQSISVSKDLGLTITQGDFNNYLLNQLQLDTLQYHDIQIRVTSSLAGGAVPVASNIVNMKARPYPIPPAVAPPPSGTLYITGDATNDGWMTSSPSSVSGQQFSQLSPTMYEITISLIGGKQYLFVPVAGDWSNKYACKNTGSQASTGGDFGLNYSSNFPGPSGGGTYKITVDFQRGKYTVVQQ